MADAMRPATVLADNLRRLKLIGNETVPLFVGNDTSVVVINYLCWKKLRKTIRLRHHYLQNMITDALINVRHIPTKHQNADIMTKALGRIAFLHTRQFLFMAAPSESFLEKSGAVCRHHEVCPDTCQRREEPFNQRSTFVDNRRSGDPIG